MNKDTLTYLPLKSGLVVRTPRYSYQVILDALANEAVFESIIRQPTFMEAIYFASPALYNEMQKYIAGQLKPRAASRMRGSLIKYLSRASTRCTPFGMFSACGAVRWGDKTRLKILSDPKPHFRIDMLTVCTLAGKLHEAMKHNDSLRYRLNSSLYRLGKRLRFVSYVNTGSGRAYELIEVPYSPLLGKIISLTAFQPVSRSAIMQELAVHTNAAPEEVSAMIDSLIDCRMLVSELDPTVTGRDCLTRIASQVGNSSVAQHLVNAVTRLDDSADFHTRHNITDEIATLLKGIQITPNRKFMLQVDSIIQQSPLILDRSIMQQISKYFNFMRLICAGSGRNSLGDFARRFEKRYEQQEIPLLEALDPEAGIGYNVTQSRISNPLIDGIDLPRRNHGNVGSGQHSALDRVLLRKLRMTSPQATAIELTDADFVGVTPVSMSELPFSMAAFFKIASVTNQGQYTFDGMHFTGSSGINMLGRFTTSSSDILDITRECAVKEQNTHADCIVAEIVHMPESRTGNILARGTIRDYEITYLTAPSVDPEHTIPASDIMLSVVNGHITLRSRRYGRRIIPRLTTAHNYSRNTTPVYRFLCDMQTHGLVGSLRFTWGRAGQFFNYLPRVCYDNLILSHRTWRCRATDLLDNGKRFSPECFRQWRSRLHLPRYIQLIEGDNDLFVDLDSPASVDAFISEITSKQSFTIEEFIFSHNIVADPSGRSHMNEFIVPLVRSKLTSR